ncbi:hypothetical protein OGAPHI_005865 [Ogataea philodendri]|uniref:AMP-activated protein kinase glycogen-binding domain-containing protein n=1 Tax=Ogataea philodendri TaxID=1378263 RepID=A0A9P8T1B3_9ASCO|nr:uncharacterized protein OGAPHI_005865 [Ogataea philodendri]KAH3662613.1 hypothetical protein OGAPHI_005865 [Ogataea philodendri]
MLYSKVFSIFAILAVASAFSFKNPVASTKQLFFEDGTLDLDLLNEKLDQCQVVQELNSHFEHESHDLSYAEYVFSKLFPFGPAGNALLATTYISGPPNFILALIPANIDVSSLSLLVSFAVGGLLGDVFLHLLPQTFLGEPLEHKASFVLVDGKRNCVLGFCIFLGFLFFFIIDKSLRVLEHTGEPSSHSHSHSHVEPVERPKSKSKKSKKSKSTKESKPEPVIANPNASVKTSAYLNLISDFTHNITDGLAIASSFYISNTVGCTTTLAVFFHEIPHEVGDFALLIQGGFTKWQAMSSQFVTAIGAYLGTVIGISIQTLSKTANETVGSDQNAVSPGLFGTTVQIGDLTLPFTAGGFLYIGFSVVPELLELGQGTSRVQELRKFIGQIFFIFVGIGFMFFLTYRPSNNAKDVYVTGTFDNWSKTHKLDKTSSGFAKIIDLPYEKTVFKFVVDNHWCTSDHDAKEYDECGNLNNVLYPGNEDGASEFTAISYPDQEADAEDVGAEQTPQDQEDLGSSTQVTLKDEFPVSQHNGSGIFSRIRALFR